MPSHRVKVTVPSDTYLVLRRLSECTGDSMSSIMASVVNPVVPMLSRLADVFEVAQAQYGRVPDASKSIIERLSSDIRAEIEGEDRPAPSVAHKPPCDPTPEVVELVHESPVQPVETDASKCFMSTFRAALKGESNDLDS